MRKLFVFDYKDYKEDGTVGTRPSARGIIVRDGRIAMVHSRKYDYYAFPGGGIDRDENGKDALIREVREETGLEVISDSIKEYGLIVRKEKGAIDDLVRANLEHPHGKLSGEEWAGHLFRRVEALIGKLKAEGLL